MKNQPEQPKSKIPLIVGTSAATALLAVGAFSLGYLGISKTDSTTPTNQIIVQNSQTVDLRIKGNKDSKIYHLRGCPNYDDIADRNIRWFKTHDEARGAGYRMAKNC